MNQILKQKVANGMRFIKKMFEHLNINPSDVDAVSNGYRDLNYLKNQLFYTVAFYFIVLGPILFFYGAYLFYEEGKFVVATIEFSLYFISLLVLINKKTNIRTKKIYLISMGYFASLLVLIVAGPMGQA